MADNSPILGLPLVRSSQTAKEVTLNEALVKLEAIVQLVVKSDTLSPTSPVPGDRYIVPNSSSYAAWSTFAAGDVAVCVEGGGWRRVTPLAGWRAYVTDLAVEKTFLAGAWAVSKKGKITVDLSTATKTVAAKDFVGADWIVMSLGSATTRAVSFAAGCGGVRMVTVTGPVAGTVTCGSVTMTVGTVYHLYVDGAGVASIVA
jgi:hypothetical protein